ncbi:MAG TPA: EAL domain-containing protein [Gallionellaceae bacterium]|nr:EAL domain-containing protein [Gallionellaceae bacterium]
MANAEAQRQPWSVSRYASAFVVLVAVTFIVLSSFVYTRLRPIMDESARNQRQLARSELESALSSAIQSSQRDLAALARWDEAKQQISHPAYYLYWHDYRVRDAGMVGPGVADVAIYNSQGAAISAGKAAHTMPIHIHSAEIGLSFVQEGNRIFIYGYAPIQQDNSALIGFVGLKVDLLAHAAKTGGMHRIKSPSLRLRQAAPHVHAASDVLDKLEFDFNADESHSAVASLLANLLVQSALLLIISTSLLFWFMHFRLAQPLRQLSRYIDNCRAGNNQPLPASSLKVMQVAELEKVRKSLREYQDQLQLMQSDLEQTNAKLWSQAHQDSMTAAYNRRAFEEDWGHLQVLTQRHEVNVCFILFDCDHFKAINDTYGHHIGDEVICSLASTLLKTLRSGERLYRLGGDEFACLLNDAGIDEGIKVAHRAEQAVAGYNFSALGILEPVRISVGLAHYRGQDAAALDRLTRQADLAMYLAKRPGNNKITIYDESMAEIADSVISSMETTAVYESLNNLDMIEMAYQPIVTLPDMATSHYEALVRLRYKGKLIIPVSIFPVVEARRLEAEFDLAVASRIARDLDLGLIPAGSGVAINISGPGILHPAVMDRLRALAPLTQKYKIVIEITETALITQIGFASINLNDLRQQGFIIALDDFGSGYSSMRYLSSMPVDTVKFDISLIRNLLGDSRQMMIVENLAQLIHNAGYQMVAEGIESEEMLQKATAVGFTYAQGYYLGTPHPLNPDFSSDASSSTSRLPG